MVTWLELIESNIIVRTNETYYEDDFSSEAISIDRNRELYNVDSLYQKIDRFDAFLFHDWDLRKYPFDRQK